jgi:hypothetical protein
MPAAAWCPLIIGEEGGRRRRPGGGKGRELSLESHPGSVSFRRVRTGDCGRRQACEFWTSLCVCGGFPQIFGLRFQMHSFIVPILIVAFFSLFSQIVVWWCGVL